MASTLEKFIHSLDPRDLPRVLQIQSGIYFQGSIYEMFGNECCLSTGEVIKVIGFKINKLIASICENNEVSRFSAKVELPLNFPGLYKVVADKTPYVSIEEITRKVSIGPTRFGHPCFYSPEDIKLANITIKHGEQITFNSVEEVNGTMTVNCGVVRNNQSHSFTLPFSQEGKFYECEDDQIYTLKEIAEWKIPKCRNRIVKLSNTLHMWDSSNPLPENFDGCLILTPVYEVQAVMKFRKDIVHILSDLDVEVKDVTDCYDISSFLQPLSLEDVFERTSKEFPMVAEIMEGPSGSQKPYNLLYTGKEIIIYKKYQATRVLASEIRSDSPKRHFLIPMSYKGKFKRRPREFPTAYDLEIARSEKEQLHVVATKAFDSPHKELFSVSVGDQFLVQQCQTSEVLYEGRKKLIDVLACEQILSDTYKKVLLPMYMEGGFVEVIHDKKQYQLSEICKEFRLPFNVKVSVRDLSIEEDVLAAVPGLQFEEEITDSYLLISSASSPMESWEIPVYRLNMSVHLLSKDGQTVVPPVTKTTVEEISEEQYYMMRRYENQTLHPPPRPPKKPTLAPKPVFAVPKQDVSDVLQAPKRDFLCEKRLRSIWCIISFDSGRLADPSSVTSCGYEDGDLLCISVRSWWSCMNYYLAVIPFLGAVEAGLFGQLQYEIEILPPEERRADFCYSVADCRSRIPKLMDDWKAYFEYLLSTGHKAVSPATFSSFKLDDALRLMWRAHVASIAYALPKFQDSLKYLSDPEANFGEDWANAVDFIAATHFSTDFLTTNNFQAFLPQRMLVEGDVLPSISDFSPQQNRVLLSMRTLHKANQLTGGLLLKVWQKAMSTEAGRKMGRKLIEDLASSQNFDPVGIYNDLKGADLTVLTFLRKRSSNID